MKSFDICCVILNYNSSSDVLELIDDLLKQKKIKLKCVVVDNNSDDSDYKRLVDGMFLFNKDSVDLIRTTTNQGYASGNNFGFYYAIKNFEFSYLSIINPDITISDDLFFARFLGKLNNKKGSEDKKIALSTCNIVGNKHSGWMFPTMVEDLLDLTYSGRLITSIFLNKKTSKSFDNTDNYDVISGCFFVISADLFFNIGGFDNGTFLYGEERLLAKKINSNEYTNIVFSDLDVTHKNGGSINKMHNNIKKMELLIKSRNYYYSKYGEWPNVYYSLSWMLFQIRRMEEKLLLIFRKMVS